MRKISIKLAVLTVSSFLFALNAYASGVKITLLEVMMENFVVEIEPLSLKILMEQEYYLM